MLYKAFQLHEDIAAPLRQWSGATRALLSPERWGLSAGASCGVVEPFRARLDASLEMIERTRLTFTRPPFGIESVPVDGTEVAVHEEVAVEMPFGDLLHFRKDTDAVQPKVLIVAALSGHFSTLLRQTAETMLVDHDVYMTDWRNARDVPLTDGTFGVDDYVDYLITFLEHLGPGAHVVAVCQPCVQALAAVAVMNQTGNPATPASLTLMAGPIDVRVNPGTVNELATEKSLSWFEQQVISTVPGRYPGAGRRVYPGFLQLTAFVSMNAERHLSQHLKLWGHLVRDEEVDAQRIIDFYDEYFAVLDLTAEFYLETIDRVFQKAELASGDFTHHGMAVDPGAIRRTALLTVEGERDDICPVGQTSVAHDLCTALRPHQKQHHLQAGVGHYGVFSGSRWNGEIYPVVRSFVLAHS